MFATLELEKLQMEFLKGNRRAPVRNVRATLAETGTGDAMVIDLRMQFKEAREKDYVPISGTEQECNELLICNNTSLNAYCDKHSMICLIDFDYSNVEEFQRMSDQRV